MLKVNGKVRLEVFGRDQNVSIIAFRLLNRRIETKEENVSGEVQCQSWGFLDG